MGECRAEPADGDHPQWVWGINNSHSESVLTGLDFMDNTGIQVDYENALINAGFGKFHFFLLTICGMIYLNTAIGITIISFVLPSATCDFQMSSSDKGLLTAAPMLGEFTIRSFGEQLPIHSTQILSFTQFPQACCLDRTSGDAWPIQKEEKLF